MRCTRQGRYGGEACGRASYLMPLQVSLSVSRTPRRFRPMPIPSRIAERLALLGLLASLAVALASVVALRDRARTVDVVAAVAGVVGALASLVALRVQRRRRAERAPATPATRAG